MVGGEWLVARAGVGLPGSEGGPAPVMGMPAVMAMQSMQSVHVLLGVQASLARMAVAVGRERFWASARWCRRLEGSVVLAAIAGSRPYQVIDRWIGQPLATLRGLGVKRRRRGGHGHRVGRGGLR